jgi:hypothetical protein
MQLCFATFAKSLQAAMQPPNDDKDVVDTLLGWITDKESVVDKKGNPIHLASSLISDLMNRKVDVPKAIKNACTSASLLSEAIAHFRTVIIPYLNPYVSDDLYETLINTIHDDRDISSKKKNSLQKLYDADKNSEFLANLLLYVINRTNRLATTPLEINDIPLLAEAGYECPTCHAPLVEYVKTTAVKRYGIVSLYPIDLIGHEAEFEGVTPPIRLDAFDNRIALCRDHAEDYRVEPTREDYIKLRDIKDRMVANYALRADVNDMALEDEIQTVLFGLVGDINEDALVELPMEALRIDQKISPDNHMLKNDETTRVLRYYNFINDMFAAMERDGTGDFELIASEVNTAYKKLDNGTLSQEEIVNQLAEWIKNKSQVGSKFIRACHIVVAYFIQNCEVFREIS